MGSHMDIGTGTVGQRGRLPPPNFYCGGNAPLLSSGCQNYANRTNTCRGGGSYSGPTYFLKVAGEPLSAGRRPWATFKITEHYLTMDWEQNFENESIVLLAAFQSQAYILESPQSRGRTRSPAL